MYTHKTTPTDMYGHGSPQDWWYRVLGQGVFIDTGNMHCIAIRAMVLPRIDDTESCAEVFFIDTGNMHYIAIRACNACSQYQWNTPRPWNKPTDRPTNQPTHIHSVTAEATLFTAANKKNRLLEHPEQLSGKYFSIFSHLSLIVIFKVICQTPF
jgi:hypothetical protein